MDWVILAGTVGHEVPWTRGLPRPLLPLPGTTLLETLLEVFRLSSDGSCTVCANGNTDTFIRRVQSGGPISRGIGFFEDSVPRGPAGCLKACESRLTGRPILVAGGSVWLDDDPEWMLQQHSEQGNVLTVFCTAATGQGGSQEGTLRKPAGVYCCEPAVLEFIHTEGYQDLKEQLIPTLQRAGLRVGAVTLQHATCEVSDWTTYMRVLGSVLSTTCFDRMGFQQAAPTVWFGERVEVAPRARIVGPVILGHDCRIADDAVVVGPAIVGNGVHLEPGTWVIRSVLPENWQCPAGSHVVDRFEPSNESAYFGDRVVRATYEPDNLPDGALANIA